MMILGGIMLTPPISGPATLDIESHQVIERFCDSVRVPRDGPRSPEQTAVFSAAADDDEYYG